MKKLFFLSLLASSLGVSQVGVGMKTSGLLQLKPNLTATFTLDEATSEVTLIVTGPADRWFGIGIGVSLGFKMASGDNLVFTDMTSPLAPVNIDRKFIGRGVNPAVDTSQDWGVVSDNVNAGVRTITLVRDLTNNDTAGEDFQMPYATTNSFSVAGVVASTATITVGSHGGTPATGYVTANFTTLGAEDYLLENSEVFPVPTKGGITIKSKSSVNSVDVYTQTGSLVKTIKFDASSNNEYYIDGLSKGVYLLELKNSNNNNSWKKAIVE